jgi:hypothetical protein
VLPRLTVALVLAGLGLLLAGVARDSLALVYLSILCTALAGVALIVFTQRSRRRGARLAAEADPGMNMAGEQAIEGDPDEPRLPESPASGPEGDAPSPHGTGGPASPARPPESPAGEPPAAPADEEPPPVS